MTADPIQDSLPVKENLARSIEFPEVFRSWFWVYYDHFGRLLLINLGWSLSALGLAWVWSRFLRSFPPNLFGFFFVFLFFSAESMLSIGWAYNIFRIFVDRTGTWDQIREGYSRFWLKGTLIAGGFWFVLDLGAFNIQSLWFHPLPNPIFNYVIMTITGWILFFWVMAGFYLWPVLFFQEPSVSKTFYRAFLLAWGSGGRTILYLVVLAVNSTVFILFPALWLFVGPVSIFSLQSVALEKALLNYRITFKDKDLPGFLETLERERGRTWREFLRPWENR